MKKSLQNQECRAGARGAALKTLAISLVAAALCGACIAGGNALPGVKEIVLPGEYPGHLQDVCWNGSNALYWAHTFSILKTDLTGKILREQPVKEHNAGIEVRNGKVYVAVCLLQNKTKGKTTPDCRVQVNVHDAETLALEREIITDIHDRSGSLCFLEDGTLLVGCLRPPEIAPDQVRFHRITPEGKLIRSYLIKLDHPVDLGIEVIKREGKRIFLCIYGHATVELDENFNRVRTHRFNGTVGLVLDRNAVWSASTKRTDAKSAKWVSKLVRRSRRSLDANAKTKTKKGK